MYVVRRTVLVGTLACSLVACSAPPATDTADSGAEPLMSKYTTVRLTTDAELSENQRQIVALLIDASREMDAIFWEQAYPGDHEALLASLEGDQKQFAEVNFGPWDRLDGNRPFVEGAGEKPPGAAFYPPDTTREEVEQAIASAEQAGNQDRVDALEGLYTLVRHDAQGKLVTIPYSKAYAEQLGPAAVKLRDAAALAQDPGFRQYLELRADALLSDDYRASDVAWMQMKDNTLDLVIGPIETYEDQLFGYKASMEAFVLLKDQEWSARLAHYAELLPDLQRSLPVDEQYKAETPGSDSDLNAYDVLFVAGDANAASKTIAINLPNDESVQLEHGTRRLQLKNAMRAKFDDILKPIGNQLIAEDQREHITFDAFFSNTMFHEVAHGLGIKNTITGKGTVREALKDQASSLEEGKADVLGLFLITQLHDSGELADVDMRDYYVTFLASIFRSIRFGSADAHGVANLVRFNFFAEHGAFSRDPETGLYRVDPERMGEAVDALGRRILMLQGDGDYGAVTTFVANYGVEGEQLRADLERLESEGIPVDIVYEQGPEVLGL